MSLLSYSYSFSSGSGDSGHSSKTIGEDGDRGTSSLGEETTEAGEKECTDDMTDELWYKYIEAESLLHSSEDVSM